MRGRGMKEEGGGRLERGGVWRLRGGEAVGKGDWGKKAEGKGICGGEKLTEGGAGVDGV